MRKARLQTRRPRGGRLRANPFRNMIVGNAYAALQDESTPLILRCVDETLKDPELAAKIDYYSRQIIKAIAAKL